MNITEYYFDNVMCDFPRLKIGLQELLNNTVGIMKLYFDLLITNQDIMRKFFSDLELYTQGMWEQFACLNVHKAL